MTEHTTLSAVQDPVERPWELSWSALATRLAESHVVADQLGDPGPLRNLPQEAALLRRAYDHFVQLAREQDVLPGAGEWLLDNFYVVQHAVRQVEENLPWGYYERLPKLEQTGFPRVYVLARQIVRRAEGLIDVEQVARFLDVYQKTRPLTMGELWALPTMLRLTIVELLAQTALDLDGVAGREFGPPISLPESLSAEGIVSNGIRSLRALDAWDWNDFFERVSLVEQVLRQDPAGVYARMTFETRDRYRKVVEALASTTQRDEVAVARRVVERAQDAQRRDADVREAHVGFYLSGHGRAQMERDLDYRPPLDVRVRQTILEHPTGFYLGGIMLLASVFLAALLGYARAVESTWGQTLAVAALSLVPAVSFAVGVMNALVTRLLPPRVLPRLDFSAGVPEDCVTMVVVPCLISGRDEVDFLLHQLELHYLSDDDPHLHFALLTDFADAPEAHMPEDEELLERVRAGVRALNRKYPRQAPGPFYLFHRHRQWNPGENSWMGWERKRGKLEEFNRLLAGAEETSYSVRLGDTAVLSKVRYVITLDADTEISRDTARRLIATLAHPLNQPVFAPESGDVVSGYTVLQPRTEVKPVAASQTPFTRIFAGDVGLDLYTRAVSDVYQDLFGEGIYVGKGIYDVAAFRRSLRDRVPENALLSHDLFEGIHGRAGLVTDEVLYEDYPPGYMAYARRLHRWVRGDWQLLPWLLPTVPQAEGKRAPNPLSIIDRWKIVDNLRRSLRSLTLLALLSVGWLWLPGSPWVWTLAALFVSVVPALSGLASSLMRRLRDVPTHGSSAAAGRNLARWALSIAFLPYEAILMGDAIATTLVRLFISRKRLLQWTTAAHTLRLFGRPSKIRLMWRQMVGGPVVAVVVGILTLWLRPRASAAAAPFLAAWLLSPLIAHWISRPSARRDVSLSDAQVARLRRLARRTWFFFERFVGPEDHWLPPDHFQEHPRGLVAHRTSPTNIGLMLTALLVAHDLGYTGQMGLVAWLRATFESLEALERYRGHFLNWYDTRRLEPLAPRYVSTVDSGNLAGCLLVLKHGLLGLADQPVLDERRWRGLDDTLGVLEEIAQAIEGDALQDAVAALVDHLRSVRRRVRAVCETPERGADLLAQLGGALGQELDRRLSELVRAEAHLDRATLRGLRLWSERVHHHLRNMQEELDMLLPWLLYLEEPPQLFVEREGVNPALDAAWRALRQMLPLAPPLTDIPYICRAGAGELARLRDALQDRRGHVEAEERVAEIDAALAWCAELEEKLDAARMAARSLHIGLQDLSERAEAYFQAMNFAFLFDAQRQVFRIGYRVGAGRLDDNHYDLLASEARIASLIAIAKGEVPSGHWLHLSRPLNQVDGRRVLLSWNGSMFEYLMPDLLIRNYAHTLLDHTDRSVIRRQVSYARQKDVPWGISESGYYRFDANMNYQYRGFGVPGLGRKRGLDEDLVITPYASLLALALSPQAVMKNLQALIDERMLGHYGLYEAVDYTPARLPLGQERAIVQSYMAHHQGMILAALDNQLEERAIVQRFHADPRVQSVELLLQEQIPRGAPVDQATEQLATVERTGQAPVDMSPWQVPARTPVPQAHFLSNGQYSVLITNDGGGYSRWGDVDLTRWRADTTLNTWGTWVYLTDQDEGLCGSVAAQPTGAPAEGQRVRFYPHRVRFWRRNRGVTSQMDVVVAPEDDVEVRRVTLTNEDGRTHRLTLSSYAEVILTSQSTDRGHPAFNKLFVESEFLPELNALLFRRRLRAPDEEPAYLLHMLIAPNAMTIDPGYETDRVRFLGRGGTVRAPAALCEAALSGTTGATLDPVMALAQSVELRAHGRVELAYVTLAASSREQALALARRYRPWRRIARTFERAQAQSEVELRNSGLDAPEVAAIDRLLSLLLYPNAALRAAPEVLARNRLGQPGLWSYGISGDYPILLVRVSSTEELALVRELLRAHTYWRKRKLKIDLVVLNQKDVGYAQELNDQLHQLIAGMDSDAWLNRRGGIFLLNAGQMEDAVQDLLLTAARVVLDAGAGALAEQLRGALRQPTPLPRFVPTLSAPPDEEPVPPVARPDDLQFDNGFGGFSADGREYVVYLDGDDWTPAPWINVVANAELGFLVSEAGGGYTWAGNSGENRLTPWRNDPVSDVPAEALYLRDEETAAIWSPTPSPARADAPYLVRHGAGYSVFEHHSHGLEQRLRLFAVPDAPVKVVHVRLRNVWERQRRLTATFYAESVLGTHRDLTQQFIVPEYNGQHEALLARNTYNTEFEGRTAFFVASKELHGLTADRAEFLGRGGSLAHPAALERVGLTGRVAPGLDPCAALQVHLELAPGETREVFFLLGQGADRAQALDLVDQYRDAGRVAEAWEHVGAFWDGVLDAVSVETPDPALDLLLNRWLLYQALSCRIWGRSALYQSSGAFGYRDQLQDVMAVLHTKPQLARAHILRAARHQFEAGDVLHWWHPPSGRGVRTRISDDLLWLPYVVAIYVEATGDEEILREEVPFRTGPALEADEHERYDRYALAEETATVYEHCRRALDRGTTAGPHGLPLMGGGDWNDGMNRVGVEGEGESVWLGWFLYAVLDRFAGLCERLGDDERARSYRQRGRELQQALEGAAWDGAWYLRAYYDDGAPLGSSEDAECQIASIAQSWAALSGAGDPERVERAMAAVFEHLVREEEGLLLLFDPPFEETARDPGYIKGYPPGVRENGGQYTHAALWAVWAFAALGQGARAVALFRLLNPIRHSDTAEKARRYVVEPYVVAADVYSAAQHRGRGGWTWYTGSSGWMYRLGLEAILGVQRLGERLRIEPHIAPDWQEYRISYRHGDARYHIRVDNSAGVGQGVEAVTLDGEELAEGKIPLVDDGAAHEVVVRLGRDEEV